MMRLKSMERGETVTALEKAREVLASAGLRVYSASELREIIRKLVEELEGK